ncbi:hypothetical protein E1A91_A07G107900v1 [Gossypium mustelinum]|uniref:Uncharacterized protein n=2 Tax=Gossypium mustelinum TaxID=34275 RepID=A0A5D2YJL9_GOSMU|nr:hypothetical protein E1A91_A07G107900v1 [Gossypium mustelinum]
MAQIRFTFRANARTFIAINEVAAAINPQLIGFHLTNRRRANIGLMADAVRLTTRSLPVKLVTMEILCGETAVRRKPLVKAVRELDCSTGVF